jgi:multidrug efflux pump subunit AcrB
MWIVRLALRRPYTFVVASMLVIIAGLLAMVEMPTDIFPVVDIPVIAVCYNYYGMSPQDMNARIITPFERILTTTVNDIDHIESQSLYGIGVVKIYFKQNANLPNSNAQVTAIGQTFIRQAPQGTQPPLIIEYNASNVPVLQLSVSSDTIPEQKLFDSAFNFMRPQLITVAGVQIPYPYGGKQRQVVVDLDPLKSAAYGISAADVSNAINSQNLILPSGTAKIGQKEYEVVLNSSVSAQDAALLNNLPIKTVNGIPIYIHDVANVRDGFIVQTNIVHSDGQRGLLLSILKNGGSSTIDVVNGVLKRLPAAQAAVPGPPGAIKVVPAIDQSIFVKASVVGVVKEALIAAGLTALMILLFLGSWRSTIIVMVSIPLSILVSIIILWALHETLNVMTLGGMALAVGILVDDATVEIENIHRNLHQRKRLVQAILDGASQIAVPAFVSTLCICIVFVPVVFITGAAKYLFTPLAMSVVFAMMTSYLLSRTLVPTLVHYLLAAEVEMYGGVIDPHDTHATHLRHIQEAHAAGRPVPPEDETPIDRLRGFVSTTAGKLFFIFGFLILGLMAGGLIAVLEFTKVFPAATGLVNGVWGWIRENPSVVLLIGLILVAIVPLCWLVTHVTWAIHNAFNKGFEKFRRAYGGVLMWCLTNRGLVCAGFAVLVLVSCSLIFAIGRDFFPNVDAGQMRLHVRCPAGTRIEQTEQYYADVENDIRNIMADPSTHKPTGDIKVMLDNMGIPNSSINLALSDGSIMSPADGEILISLSEGHKPTEYYQNILRRELPKRHPELQFFFAPADIITQVLNFGLQAPIDVQIATGKEADLPKLDAMARKIQQDVSGTAGIVDVRMQQVPKTPDIRVNVDRTLASEAGVTQQSVASDMLISLSSSEQTAPNYWLGSNGVNYSIYVQTPQYKNDTVNDLEDIPITPTNVPPTPANTQLLGNLATIARETSPTNITHYDIKNTRDVLAAVQGTDLWTAKDRIQEIVDRDTKDKPAGTSVQIRGQVQSMTDSFVGLGEGLVFAVVLVYLLMVVNFQSWLDPFIILMALPGALSGILWMLWATQTHISVPALMGAIMSIGVATSNSILMITFANDQRKEGHNAYDAALSAGVTRLRPVIMTALAMIIGMLPMSLGLGEGGEQNAPLGRAVIGGLSFATFATLLFVPVMYSLLRQKAPVTEVEEELR